MRLKFPDSIQGISFRRIAMILNMLAIFLTPTLQGIAGTPGVKAQTAALNTLPPGIKFDVGAIAAN
jgi:hypothetical protein